METFRMVGDNNRLYFKNSENRPDDVEFAEVMKILKEGAIISDKNIAPDCDWYQNGKIGEEVFDIIYTIDGEGTFLYVENGETLDTLERLFETNHNKQCFLLVKNDNLWVIILIQDYLERRCHYGHAGIKEPDLPRRKSRYRV